MWDVALPSGQLPLAGRVSFSWGKAAQRAGNTSLPSPPHSLYNRCAQATTRAQAKALAQHHGAKEAQPATAKEAQPLPLSNRAQAKSHLVGGGHYPADPAHCTPCCLIKPTPGAPSQMARPGLQHPLEHFELDNKEMGAAKYRHNLTDVLSTYTFSKTTQGKSGPKLQQAVDSVLQQCGDFRAEHKVPGTVQTITTDGAYACVDYPPPLW